MKTGWFRALKENPEKVFLVSISFLFILSRFLFLGDRPLHHDESLYAIEAWRYAKTGQYQFNPMLHGPFLFHLHAFLFKIFPAGDFTSRLPSVLSGLAFTFLGYIFLRRFSFRMAAAFLVLALVSPSLTFFSRFLGMDALLCALTMGLLLSGYKLLLEARRSWLLSFFSISAVMACTKLNFLFIFFAIFTFPLALYVFDFEGFRKLLGRIRDTFRRISVLDYVLAMAIFVLLFCLFYSSFGSNWGGILDGLYRKMIPYWVNQHKIRRVAGPMDYYWSILFVYELPWILLLLIGALAVSIKKNLLKFSAILSLSLFGLGTLGHFFWNEISTLLSSRLHVDLERHLWVFLGQLFLYLVLLRHFLLKKEEGLAFLAHWFFVALFLYGYAGEKVPWLSIHLVLPLLLLCAVWGAKVFPVTGHLKPLAVAMLASAILWQGFVMIRANFLMESSPKELLVYTHTSEEISDLVKVIQNLNQKDRPSVVVRVEGDAAWPLYWYFRDIHAWYSLQVDWKEEPVFAIMNWEHRRPPPDGLKYALERKKLREWWVPDGSKLTIRSALRYFLFRETFSPLGSQDIAVYKKR